MANLHPGRQSQPGSRALPTVASPTRSRDLFLLPSVLSAEQTLLTLLLALVMCPGPWPTVLRIPPLQHLLPFGQNLHIESYFLF